MVTALLFMMIIYIVVYIEQNSEDAVILLMVDLLYTFCILSCASKKPRVLDRIKCWLSHYVKYRPILLYFPSILMFVLCVVTAESHVDSHSGDISHGVKSPVA